VIALKIAIAAMTVATGLATTKDDLGYLLRRPGLLARSLIATIVVAPLVAIGLCLAIPVGQATAIAVIAAALAPGLPSIPRTGASIGGNAAFACGLMVVTSVLGVVTVPIWLWVIGRITGIAPATTPLAIARTLAVGILIPLAVGLAVRWLAPTIARRIVGPVGTIAVSLLPGLALVLLIVGAEAIGQLGWAALAVMVIAPVIALAVGHALGGPDPRDRTVLAISNATRFPALAALIATTSYPHAQAIPAVIAYLIVALLISLPYELWRKRVHGRVAREGPVSPAGASAPSGAPA
jgi:BASS family bile acid:Na+ symporter